MSELLVVDYEKRYDEILHLKKKMLSKKKQSIDMNEFNMNPR